MYGAATSEMDTDTDAIDFPKATSQRQKDEIAVLFLQQLPILQRLVSHAKPLRAGYCALYVYLLVPSNLTASLPLCGTVNMHFRCCILGSLYLHAT